jgi:hypothetical protein
LSASIARLPYIEPVEGRILEFPEVRQGSSRRAR